jgi:hypothetical protein
MGLLTLFPQHNPLGLDAANQLRATHRSEGHGLLDQAVEEQPTRA